MQEPVLIPISQLARC